MKTSELIAIALDLQLIWYASLAPVLLLLQNTGDL